MAFAPLPADLLNLLPRLRQRPALELGCGDGRFARQLATHGVRAWGLDLVPPALGSAAQVVGDARRPPLRPGCWGLVFAANLLRHLDPGGLDRVLTRWRDLLSRDGALFLLEDVPGGRTPAERNFAALHELLADLPGRGPLLPWPRVRTVLDGLPGALQAAGEEENRYPLDGARVVAFLESGQPAPQAPAARLARAIARDGISCGRFWWARLGSGR